MEEQLINQFISFDDFKKIHQIESLQLKEEDLLIIYRIIENNKFVLTNDHYLPALFHYIKEKTSLATSLKLKSLFQDNYSIFVNV